MLKQDWRTATSISDMYANIVERNSQMRPLIERKEFRKAINTQKVQKQKEMHHDTGQHSNEVRLQKQFFQK